MVSKSAADILKFVRADILEMLGYEPIEPSDVLAERLGIPADQVAKLDGNENPYGPSAQYAKMFWWSMSAAMLAAIAASGSWARLSKLTASMRVPLPGPRSWSSVFR